MHSSRMRTDRCSGRLGGCLPRGCLPRGGWSAQDGGVCPVGCLHGECLPRGVYTSPMDRMIDACENITFPKLLRTITTVTITDVLFSFSGYDLLGKVTIWKRIPSYIWARHKWRSERGISNTCAPILICNQHSTKKTIPVKPKLFIKKPQRVFTGGSVLTCVTPRLRNFRRVLF